MALYWFPHFSRVCQEKNPKKAAHSTAWDISVQSGTIYLRNQQVELPAAGFFPIRRPQQKSNKIVKWENFPRRRFWKIESFIYMFWPRLGITFSPFPVDSMLPAKAKDASVTIYGAA